MNSRYLPLLKNYRQEEGNEVPPTASVSNNQLRGDGPSLGGFITSHRADLCFMTHGAHHWSSLYFHDSHWTTSHRKPILHLTSCECLNVCTEICRLYLLDPRFAWLKAAVNGNHRSWSYQRLSSDIHPEDKQVGVSVIISMSWVISTIIALQWSLVCASLLCGWMIDR